MMYLVPARQVC